MNNTSVNGSRLYKSTLLSNNRILDNSDISKSNFVAGCIFTKNKEFCSLIK